MRELFLTSFGGIQYGIWKDEIKSVSDIDALHRIPLSPACIAGITIVDGRTVTLADIPVCMGYGSSQGVGQGVGQGVKQGNIFIKEAGDKVMGFVVSGEIRTQSISPQLLFPLPDFLKTPVFDSCAVHDDIPIPVINTTVLHTQVLESDGESPADAYRIHNAQPQDISAIAQVRIFSAGGEFFAVSAAGMGDTAVKPGPITPLPNTPQYVKGVTFWKGRLLPVIDLSRRIKRQSVAADALMLITEIGGAAFGLLIDGDGETLPANIISIKPAPFLAQNSWLRHMMVRGGELIPLLDLALALSPGAADEKPSWQRYAPDSGFSDLLFKRDVEVVEFALLGERHALPKMEVADVIAFKPCRALPDVPPIVIGVAEHKGEILPVVDLAMMFGRWSLATSSWRMMLVKNGDFRALVITETIFGERQLALEIQRAVPIHLPHQFVYGCYPDAEVVRLIMNVETIAVYFERSHIKKFLPALSHEMKQSPTGVPYNFLDEKIGEASQHLVTVAPVATGRELIDMQEASAMASERTAEIEKVDVARTAALSASAQQSLPFSDASAQREQAQREQAQREQAQWEQAQREQAQREQAQREQAQREQAQREQAQKVSATVSLQAEKVPGSVQAKSGGTSGSQTVIPLTKRAGVPVPEAPRPSAPVHAKTIERPSGSYRTYFEEQRIIKERKRRVVYGVIAVVLIALIFYFTRSSNKPVVEQTMKAAEPAKTEQIQAVVEPPVKTTAELAKEKAEQAKMQAELAKARDEQAKLETAQAKATAKAEREAKLKAEQEAQSQAARAKTQAKASEALVLSPEDITQTAPPRPAEKIPAPLELDVPQHMPPVDIDVYVVVQGDTLWSVSERFTGNPFNYPRIAGENKIADPDLIFPGQRIRLIK